MKITKFKVKMFEDTQKQHGTKVAIQNILWEMAADIMTDLGVKKLHTTYENRKKST